MGLAVANCEAAYGYYPPARDDYSWRIAIAPFIASSAVLKALATIDGGEGEEVNANVPLSEPLPDGRQRPTKP